MLQIIERIVGEQRSYCLHEGERGMMSGTFEAPVTLGNLRVAMGMQGGKLTNGGGDLPLDQILCFLKENGYILDNSLNIRHLVREPLLNLRAGSIGAMVMLHLEVCNVEGKSPEDLPMHSYWSPEIGQRAAIKINNQMSEIPDNQQGAINVYNGDQVVLSYHEWHFVPRNERILFLRRNLQVIPTFAKSIRELCTGGMVLVDDGRLIRSGMDKLWIANLEVDEVIKRTKPGESPNKFPKPDDNQSNNPTCGPVA